MKPSDILLLAPNLLSSTFKRAESEQAAAIIVRTCQVLGDEWKAVTPQEIGKAMKDDLDNKTEPFYSLSNNPFFRPDFHELVGKGFATCAFETGAPIEFTEEGMAALKKCMWNREKETLT